MRGIQRGVAGQGGQTKREITKSHSLLGDISGARILMYHEEHSLLNGHFTQFLCIFYITLKHIFRSSSAIYHIFWYNKNLDPRNQWISFDQADCFIFISQLFGWSSPSNPNVSEWAGKFQDRSGLVFWHWPLHFHLNSFLLRPQSVFTGVLSQSLHFIL